MLCFNNTIDTSRYFTTGPEVGLSQAVQKVSCSAQRSDKNAGRIYNPSSAVCHRLNLLFYAWCAAAWKANAYLHFVIHTNSQSINPAKHIVMFTITLRL
jgi:hypothetical protein